MPETDSRFASQQEIEQLREEVRRLREEQERRDRADSDGHEPGAQDQQEESEPKKKPHPLRKWIIGAVVLLIAVGVLLYWLHSRRFEGTDDAYVEGHISGVAARIAGQVTGVYAEENQAVRAGQLLVDIDPRDYQAALAQARGQLLQARNQALAEQPNVPVTEVTSQTEIATSGSAVAAARAGVAAAERNYQAAVQKLREDEANNRKAQADVDRYRPLAERDEVPREQFDQVQATAQAQTAKVAADDASAQAALQQVDQARDQLVQAQQRAQEAVANAPRLVSIRRANVNSRRGATDVARAQVEQAALSLSYCKIFSPVNGIIARRIAEVGQNVAPGQQVFLVTQIDDLWVTANFRETQLRQVHPGQSAAIHVDALDTDFEGYVEGMPAASGAVTSLLPPENATGNFVKIVQRLPVRIRFRKNQPGMDRLRPGMSVEPKVRIR